jgi:diguanylate cyclase (GGDEF)-like protein
MLRIGAWRFIGIVFFLLTSSALRAQEGISDDIDRAEELSWTDPPAALRLLDRLQPDPQDDAALVRWLMVQGLAHAATRDQDKARAVVQRLAQLSDAHPAAAAARHIVQSFLLHEADQFDQAAGELQRVADASVLPAYERFRIDSLLGDSLTYSGSLDAAMETLKRALELGQEMRSNARTVEALMRMSTLFVFTSNVDRAELQLAQARKLAEDSNDDILLTLVYHEAAFIASARGDRLSQERALRQSLSYAMHSGSDRLRCPILIGLGDYYVQTGNFRESIPYSKQAFELARGLPPDYELFAGMNLGLAEIGLGHLADGKRLVEYGIQQFRQRGNLTFVDFGLQGYEPALERAGDLHAALRVFREDDEVHKKLASAASEKALQDLSAKFDAERRAGEVELLKRDNLLKSRDLEEQRLRQRMTIMAAALIVLICGALGWGISRMRKLNARLLYSSHRDALTGLLNRRYFNDHILQRQGAGPFVGCLLLVEVDHLKRINDEFGHAAGDEVLVAVSKRLANAMRDSDALVRWGGEEFLVILGPMSEAQLNLAARRLLGAMRYHPISWNSRSISCAVSIGYASFPLKGVAIDIPLDRAITLVDKALLQAKRRGRDRACLIELLNAGSEEELKAINTGFEQAAVDQRVQLLETVSELA